MPQSLHKLLPGVPRHIVQFGHNHEACFFSDRDYSRYLEFLQQAAINNHVAIHAYVLMRNHVHLLLTPDTGYGIGHVMQDVSLRYASHVSAASEGSGFMLDGGYKTSLVESEAYLLSCMRYIESNPVREGLVHSPEAYRWSSFQSNAMGKYDPLLETHKVYDNLGSSRVQRQLAYRKLFDTELSPSELKIIRDAINHEQVLGRDAYRKKIEQITRQQLSSNDADGSSIEEQRSDYSLL